MSTIHAETNQPPSFPRAEIQKLGPRLQGKNQAKGKEEKKRKRKMPPKRAVKLLISIDKCIRNSQSPPVPRWRTHTTLLKSRTEGLGAASSLL